MCVQQFFVANMIREAIGGLCPQYLIVDSNTLFECESLRRTIGDSRISPLGQRLSVRADMTLMVECSFEQFNDKVLDAIFALERVDREKMLRKISEILGSYRESEEEVMNRNFTTVEGRSYIIVQQDLSLRLMTQQKDIDEVYIIWKDNRNSRIQLFTKKSETE